MFLFGQKRKAAAMAAKRREDAIAALKTQLGFDLYQSGEFSSVALDDYYIYYTTIKEGYDFMAVINRKTRGQFAAKEWYIYDDASGWVKKGTMNRQQSLQLYADTNPYSLALDIEEEGGRMTPSMKEKLCFSMCEEYLSSYMTRYYFGFSLHLPMDEIFGVSSCHTEAIYMPYRDSQEYVARHRAEFNAKIDAIIDDYVARNGPN